MQEGILVGMQDAQAGFVRTTASNLLLTLPDPVERLAARRKRKATWRPPVRPVRVFDHAQPSRSRVGAIEVEPHAMPSSRLAAVEPALAARCDRMEVSVPPHARVSLGADKARGVVAGQALARIIRCQVQQPALHRHPSGVLEQTLLRCDRLDAGLQCEPRCLRQLAGRVDAGGDVGAEGGHLLRAEDILNDGLRECRHERPSFLSCLRDKRGLSNSSIAELGMTAAGFLLTNPRSSWQRTAASSSSIENDVRYPGSKRSFCSWNLSQCRTLGSSSVPAAMPVSVRVRPALASPCLSRGRASTMAVSLRLSCTNLRQLAPFVCLTLVALPQVVRAALQPPA